MSEAPAQGAKTQGAERNVAAEARRAFARWVDEAPEGSPGRVFGQVIVRPTGHSGYELRHAEDADADGAGLELFEEARSARGISKLTGSGEYRPLKSAPNLRRGWLLRVADDRELAVAMNLLYPAAVAHWHLHREGELEITNYRQNAARQSGIYKRVQRLSDKGVRDAARACCEDAVCLKKTLWDVDEDISLTLDRGDGEIPCPEPCSIFVSFARRVRLFEKEDGRKPEGAVLTPSEAGDLAALVEAAADGGVEFAREADFEEPLDERRLRYRRLTLVPRLRPEE